MATSAVAAGKLNVARARGKPIPLGWLLDKEGRPTTDPNAQLEGGVMLPLGGPEGHKGYGLSFAVEALAAVLPGLGFGVDPKGRHNDGTFMLVVDPTAFSPGDFEEQIEAFVHYLKATRPPRASTRSSTPARSSTAPSSAVAGKGSRSRTQRGSASGRSRPASGSGRLGRRSRPDDRQVEIATIFVDYLPPRRERRRSLSW